MENIMTLNRLKTKPNIKSLRVALAVTALIALLGFAGYKLWGPPSPEAIRDRTIRALENRDAQTLCQLADPEELKRLNLTPQKVSAFLNETLWREGSLKKAKIEKFTPTPDDQSVWEVQWATDKPKTPKLAICCIDDPKKGWKLVTSYLLWSTCWRKQKSKEGIKEYYALAQKHGIAGVRFQGGGYNNMAQLEKMIKDVFKE